MRNNKLKIVREAWSHSKFFIGKNRVLAKALGNSEEEEYSDKLHLISKCLKNECGLLMTNQSEEEVVDYFSRLSEPDFARTGGLATQTVELQQGVLNMFSHSMEPQLRQLGNLTVLSLVSLKLLLSGMPVQLVKGQVTLLVDYTVCEEGDVLSSEQARILKLLGKIVVVEQQSSLSFGRTISNVHRNKGGTFKCSQENVFE